MKLKNLAIGDQVRVHHGNQLFYGHVTKTGISIPTSKYLSGYCETPWTDQQPVGHSPIGKDSDFRVEIAVDIGVESWARSKHLNFWFNPTPQDPEFFLLLGTAKGVTFTNICSPNDLNEQTKAEMLDLLIVRSLERIIKSKYCRFVQESRLLPLEDSRVEGHEIVFEIGGRTKRIKSDMCSQAASDLLVDGYVIYGLNVKKYLEKQAILDQNGFPPDFIHLLTKGGRLSATPQELRKWAMAFYYDPKLLERIAMQAIREQIA